MNIVILNECFFNENHLSKLRGFGELTIYNDTDTEEKTIERIKDADIVIGDQFVAKFDKSVLAHAKNLKLLALNTISFAYTDVDFAKTCNVKVSNIPGFSKQSVAELALGLLLSLNRKIALGDRMMREEPFELDPGNEKDRQFIGADLHGKTLGIIGLGNIGTVMAKIGVALNMKVIAYNRTQKHVEDAEMVSLDELLQDSDFISAHIPLTDETRGLISAQKIGLMKPGALLIITSQMEITDMEALKTALKEKRIGAGLDIGGKAAQHEDLLKLDNVVLAPHSGSFTQEAFYRNMPDMIVENVEAFISGNPKHLVN